MRDFFVALASGVRLHERRRDAGYPAAGFFSTPDPTQQYHHLHHRHPHRRRLRSGRGITAMIGVIPV